MVNSFLGVRNGYFDVDFWLEARWLLHMQKFLLAAQLKSVGLSLQSTLHAALFLLSPWQLGSWFDSEDTCVHSSVQQNHHSDEALLWLCNALFFLIRTSKKWCHLLRLSLMRTSSHLLLTFSVHALQLWIPCQRARVFFAALWQCMYVSMSLPCVIPFDSSFTDCFFSQCLQL